MNLSISTKFAELKYLEKPTSYMVCKTDLEGDNFSKISGFTDAFSKSRHYQTKQVIKNWQPQDSIFITGYCIKANKFVHSSYINPGYGYMFT